MLLLVFLEFFEICKMEGMHETTKTKKERTRIANKYRDGYGAATGLAR